MNDAPDFERRLAELGDALDHPDGADLIANVGAELAELRGDELAPVRDLRGSRRSVALLAAAAVVVGVVAIPTSRHAIADLFRSGRVEIRSAKDFPREPHSSTTTTTITPGRGAESNQHDPGLESARRHVEFPIRLPQLVPARTPIVTVDASVPGGLVVLDYGEFRVVEVSAGPGLPVIAKGLDPGARIQPIIVGTAPGVWITGSHHFVAYLDRDGHLRRDTVREAGHVLLWANDGVTFRIEGFHQLAAARQVADAIP